MLKKVAFKVFYLGSDYHGFQMQSNYRTVENEIKKFLIRKEYINSTNLGDFNYSSRTDKGVHALEQIIVFDTDKEIFIPTINKGLPNDIIIWGYKELDKAFNPRYDVEYRHYKYIFIKDYHEYDFNLMKEAAKLFVGTHDFSNFSKLKNYQSPLREILKFDIHEDENCYIFDVIGKSFLRQMVRRMVKSILDVSLSKISIKDIEKSLDPSFELVNKYGPAPLEPNGSLILFKIKNDIKFEIDHYSKETLLRFLQQRIREHVLKTNYFNIILKEVSKEKDEP